MFVIVSPSAFAITLINYVDTFFFIKMCTVIGYCTDCAVNVA
jgi:hypothetical protein